LYTLLDGAKNDPDKAFAQALDHELEKITSFYNVKELEILGELDELLADYQAFEADHEAVDGDQNGDQRIIKRTSTAGQRQRQNSIFKGWGFQGRGRPSITGPSLDRIESGSDSGEDDEVDGSKLKKAKTNDSAKNGSESGNRRLSVDVNALRKKNSAAFDDVGSGVLSAAYDSGATLKKRMVIMYVSLCELRSFVQLNKTGFSKVLKKYDKTIDRNLKQSYIDEKIVKTSMFTQETMDRFNERITQVEQAYANLNTGGNLDHARRELRLDVRERVVWERNTVWREMIGIERKAQAANLGIRQTMLGNNKDQLEGEDQTGGTKEFSTFAGTYRCPRFILNPTIWLLISILSIFTVLLVIPIMEAPEQQNCLAMVVLVSLMWATEVGIQL